MRPPGTAHELERRRQEAVRLPKAGAALSAITWAVGASVSSVYRVGRDLPQPGAPWITATTDARSFPSLLGAEEVARGAAPEEAPGHELSHRFMDLETCGAADPPAVRGTLPSLSCLEAPDPVGMELSEPRTPRAAAERGRDRPMETVPLAAYKKRRTTGRPSGLLR